MGVPKSIRLGGKEWRVKRKRRVDSEGSCGECDYATSTLSVATGLSPFDLKDTLLHETIHAILAQHTQWVRTVEEEEAYVLAIATGITGVLQDNPEFAKWLIAPIPPPKR